MRNNTDEKTLFGDNVENDERTIFENDVRRKEETLFDSTVRNNEDTCIENTVVPSDKIVEEMGDKKNSKSRWGKVASGIGMGILLGGTASFVSASTIQTSLDNKEHVEEGNEGEEVNVEGNDSELITHSTITWTDGALPVAETVSDEMTFSEAFGAARAEVGAGGVFEWRGNVYNTYYASEWNEMSDEDKDNFVAHLNLTDIEDDSDSFTTQTVSNDTSTNDVVEVTIDDLNDTNQESHDTIEVVNTVTEVPPVDDTVGNEDIEVLGVYYDDDLGVNVGAAIIEGNEVILLDADNDGENFELMAVDANNDGQFGYDEIIDISEYDIPVDAFRVNELGDSYIAYEDTLDYTSDADISDMM